MNATQTSRLFLGINIIMQVVLTIPWYVWKINVFEFQSAAETNISVISLFI